MSDAHIHDSIAEDIADHDDTTIAGHGIPMVEEEDSPLNSQINTTPLVDIMLVMLIIFLITVPVVVGTVEVNLPVEANRVMLTRPDDVNISVDSRGNVYWGESKLASEDELFRKLAAVAVLKPQPEVHIRGDADTEYLNVGKVVEAAQRAGILKVGFVTKKPIGAPG